MRAERAARESAACHWLAEGKSPLAQCRRAFRELRVGVRVHIRRTCTTYVVRRTSAPCTYITAQSAGRLYMRCPARVTGTGASAARRARHSGEQFCARNASGTAYLAGTCAVQEACRPRQVPLLPARPTSATLLPHKKPKETAGAGDAAMTRRGAPSQHAPALPRGEKDVPFFDNETN